MVKVYWNELQFPLHLPVAWHLFFSMSIRPLARFASTLNHFVPKSYPLIIEVFMWPSKKNVISLCWHFRREHVMRFRFLRTFKQNNKGQPLSTTSAWLLCFVSGRVSHVAGVPLRPFWDPLALTRGLLPWTSTLGLRFLLIGRSGPLHVIECC